jgi:hypothetical protein
MRRRGWLRLWIVATLVGVPGFAFWQVNDSMRTWDSLDKMAIDSCVAREGTPNFDVDKCAHEAGVGKTMFEHEGTTPGRYWSEALGVGLLFDLVLTGLVVGAFLVIRWVVRGFKDDGRPANT